MRGDRVIAVDQPVLVPLRLDEDLVGREAPVLAKDAEPELALLDLKDEEQLGIERRDDDGQQGIAASYVDTEDAHGSGPIRGQGLGAPGAVLHEADEILTAEHCLGGLDPLCLQGAFAELELTLADRPCTRAEVEKPLRAAGHGKCFFPLVLRARKPLKARSLLVALGMAHGARRQIDRCRDLAPAGSGVVLAEATVPATMEAVSAKDSVEAEPIINPETQPRANPRLRAIVKRYEDGWCGNEHSYFDFDLHLVLRPVRRAYGF